MIVDLLRRVRSVAPSRMALSALLAVGGLWLVVRASLVRAWEARAAAAGIGVLTPGRTGTNPETASFFWALGTPRAHGLQVTVECSNAYIVGPLLLGAAGLILLGRLAPPRVILGVVAAAVLMASVNFLRLVMISWSIHRFGPGDGFWWSHVVVGSVLSLAGFAVGLGLAVRLGMSERRRLAEVDA